MDLSLTLPVCLVAFALFFYIGRRRPGKPAVSLRIERPSKPRLTDSAAALALDNAPPRRRTSAPPLGVPMAAVCFAATPEAPPQIIMRSAAEILNRRQLSCYPSIHQQMLIDPVRREHETDFAGPITFRGCTVGEGRRCRLCSKVLTWPRVCA